MKVKRSVASKVGYRKASKINFFLGDAKEKLAMIPDGSVNLVVTSPPYNIGKEYERRVPMAEYLNSQGEMLNHLVRVLHRKGSLCWQVGSYINNGEIYPLDIIFYEAFKKLGLKLRNRIVWHYRHGLHAERRFSGRYETILWFTKSDDYVFNLDSVRVPALYPGKRHYKGPKKGKPSGNRLGKNPSDFWHDADVVLRDWKNAVWDIPNVKANHPEKTIQPCQFPVELVARCVLALTKPNDTVLDPFAGVGSTLVGALVCGRRAIGVEKEKKYYDVAVKRLQQVSAGTVKLRPIGKPVYVPSGKDSVSKIPTEWETIKRVRSSGRSRKSKQR